MKLNDSPITNRNANPVGLNRRASSPRAATDIRGNEGYGEFSVESTVAGVQFALARIFRVLAESRAEEREVSSVIVAVGEALTNAVEHGNAYADGKRVHVSYSMNESEVGITIEDDGEGFCVSCVADPARADRLHHPRGRGMLLMKKFASSIQYNQRGNRVTIRKSLRNSRTEDGPAVQEPANGAKHAQTLRSLTLPARTPISPPLRRGDTGVAPETAKVRESFIGLCVRAAAGATLLAGGLALIATLWLMPLGLLFAFLGTALFDPGGSTDSGSNA